MTQPTSCAGAAFVDVSSTSGNVHEGFVMTKMNGACEFHWMRFHGVDPCTGSLTRAWVEMSPSLELILGGSGALRHVSSRLQSAPSVDQFVADLQEVLERLSYGTTAGPGPGSRGALPTGSSSQVMQLLLRDLDEIGWHCLEEFDQEAARMTLVHLDERGRENRLRLSLPRDYPGSPPAAVTDLPKPFAFSWRPPAASGHAGGGGGGGGFNAAAPLHCSSLADVFVSYKQAVSRCQPLWRCLDDLDTRTRVLDPPPSVSAARRHLGPPARRLALGGAASLQLRLDPDDPTGPPPPGGAAFLGPPDSVSQLREAFFARLHLWSRDSDLVDNLELLLGQPLPAPQAAAAAAAAYSHRREGRRRDSGGGADIDMDADDDEEGAAAAADKAAPVMAECPICMMHVLPLEETEEGEADDGAEDDADAAMKGDDGDVRERGGTRSLGEAGGGGSGGLVPDVACPTPACGLVFHTPCLAEWLRSLPDTRVSFSKLFGRCPFCSNPITVRA